MGADFGETAVILRDATPGDEAAWRGLWHSYLDFYSVDLAPEITTHTWARLMDPASPMQVRMAFDGRQALGFAIHHHHCSTWVMGDDGYLEDLFVDASARGKGVGRALIEDLVKIAKSKGWKRLYWHTNADNVTARALYDTFVASDGHIRYRIKL